MAYFEQDFIVGARDVDSNLLITNKTILGMFEDIGSFHSDSAGCGLGNIRETNLSWVIMHWKVEILRRAKYGEKIKIRTWCAAVKKIYWFRQYEVLDETGNVIIKCNSKWVLTDLNTGAVNAPDWIVNNYGMEERTVFSDWKIDKLKEPENQVGEINYVVPCSAIDVNGHMNNLYYLDVCVNAMDPDLYFKQDVKSFQIMYKKESTLGENLKCKVYKDNDEDVYVIKTEDDRHIHAIVSFK